MQIETACNDEKQNETEINMCIHLTVYTSIKITSSEECKTYYQDYFNVLMLLP